MAARRGKWVISRAGQMIAARIAVEDAVGARDEDNCWKHHPSVEFPPWPPVAQPDFYNKGIIGFFDVHLNWLGNGAFRVVHRTSETQLSF